ncbi:MAG: TlpA disulfide reductase family protein, partial [Bacteroidota bacterium]|nr:TlpA disulfide reductase family protein [Bacteroidota bacterium]
QLQQIGMKLKQLEHVSYSYQIKAFRSYDPDTTIWDGQIYFEADPSDTAWGYKFHREGELQKSFYNSEYIVFMNQRDSTARKKPFCDYQDGHMTGYPYLDLSFAAITNFLTDSLFSTNIHSLVRTDTVLDQKACHLYTFWADAKLVDIYKLFQKDQKLIKLAIRKEDHLPVFYSQYDEIPRKNTTDHLYSEVHFKDFSFKKRSLSHQFSIERVPEYYDWDWINSISKVLPVQSPAPNWTLPLVHGDSLSLSSLKGKYVLIDFWFIGCGACLQSIPTLNTLHEKHGKNRLEIIGVNCYSKDKEAIQEYCSDKEMKYKNVWKGNLITDAYLIKGAPIFFLIDPEGTIVYSQVGHDEEKLISNVDSFLK